jgi:ketosteroid isomerase-like protein
MVMEQRGDGKCRGYYKRDGDFEQMAVHAFGDVAVVSFLQAAMSGERRDPARDIATVDVRRRAGDAWKLAVRYAGPAGGRGFIIPGASMQAPIEKRY